MTKKKKRPKGSREYISIRSTSAKEFFAEVTQFGDWAPQALVPSWNMARVPLSRRMQLYHLKGTSCVSCGLEGDMVHEEREWKHATIHFNVYHVAPDGKETMITNDHILAKSLGGTNDFDNLQPMCARCNGKKGALTAEEWEVRRSTAERQRNASGTKRKFKWRVDEVLQPVPA